MVLSKFHGYEGRNYGPVLMTLFAAVGVIQLIACVNLANLMLARAASRVSEVTIRATLGAGRGRIARQLLAESLLISLLGGLCGLLLTYAFIPALLAINPIDAAFARDVRVDNAVLGFTLLMALGTGLVFGLVPAWQSSRTTLSRDSGKASAGRGSGRLRQILVVAEVALSLMLLIGAAIFVRSFHAQLTIDPGFETSRVVLGQMTMSEERYGTAEKVSTFYRRGLERLRANPMVESAAVVSNVPLERGLNWIAKLPGQTEMIGVEWRYGTLGAFSTLRIPLHAGRDFTEADTGSTTPVVIVNERFARQHFARGNPLGEMVFVGNEPGPRRVIGVVGNVKQNNLSRPALPTLFIPVAQATGETLAMSHQWFKPYWVRGRGGTKRGWRNSCKPS